jgi:N-terminal EH-domain containing protein
MDWANEPSTYASDFSRTEAYAGSGGGGGGGGGGADEIADRTANIAAHLKKIYRKSILPVEKKYRYDYFYDSPLLTDVEFDCKLNARKRQWTSSLADSLISNTLCESLS